MNADEVLTDLQNRLGDEFGTDLNNLTNAYLNILVDWRFYRSLYGTNPERIALLNSCSGHFFYVIEKSLFESVVLGLCRLLDPIESGRGRAARRNMTFLRLTDHLTEGDERAGYSVALNTALANSDFARDWRNRRLAHSDFDVARGTEALQPASRARIQTLVDSVGELIRYIYQNCLESDYLLNPILSIEDEMRVLRLLHFSIVSEEERRTRNQEALDRRAHEQLEPEPEIPEWLINQE